MAQEIEKYLMEKFSNDLCSKEDIPLFKDFKNLEAILKEKMESSSSDIKSLRENLFKVNDFLNECLASSGKRALFSHTIRGIRQELREMHTSYKGGSNGSSNGNVTSQQKPPPNPSVKIDAPRWKSRLLDPEKIRGFDDQVKEFEDLLIGQGSGEKFRALGITGAVSSGKTTLCQILVNSPNVKAHFLPRIGFYIASCDKDSTLKGLLDALGVEEKMVNEIYKKYGTAGLCCAVNIRLVGKRYLIVLDGAQDTNEWLHELSSSLPENGKFEDRLAYGLPKGYGGAVIVTSRDEKVAEYMVGEENVHGIKRPSDGSC